MQIISKETVPAIWITITTVIVAIIGKFIGNMFAASFAGNTLSSASTIGVVMMYQLESFH